MHVFIDTNILLNFFHFSKEDIDTVTTIFASQKHDPVIVYLTTQLHNEFKRNREAKIKDALNRFREKYNIQIPHFMRQYEEHEEIRELLSELKKKQETIIKKAESDTKNRNLLADNMFKEIFQPSKIFEISPEVFDNASKRLDMGNPPGKKGSMGDAINWEVLLAKVPKGEDIHIISEDKDYYSVFDDQSPHPFLYDEWTETKTSEMYVYRTLAEFIKKHFDSVAFTFDTEKESLIDSLSDARSFASTHDIIADLQTYSYFSLDQVRRILSAAVENDQVGGIVVDHDVSDFLNRVAVPRTTDILDTRHKEILQDVIDEQKRRHSS